MSTAHEAEKDHPLPILVQLRIWLHILCCHGCAEELKGLHRLEEIMKTGFFPPAPDFGDLVMEGLQNETCMMEEKIAAPAGFSFRSWVIIGFFVLFSLSSAFFGVNFIEIADTEGLSFLLPVGITIGIVLTCYGALFIGSHLKELSTRFGLH